jgi:hypothetical protein
MSGKIYANLIKSLNTENINRKLSGPPEVLANGPGNAKQRVWLNGQEHQEGLNLSFTWGIYCGQGNWQSDQKAHKHPYPECYIFTGLDTANINYLGADIEISLGEEQEIYSFNEATAVNIPAGLPHGPIVTKQVFSPKGFGCFQILPEGKWETTWLRDEMRPVNSTGKYAHLLKLLKSGLLIERGKLTKSQISPEKSDFIEGISDKIWNSPGPASADHLTWMSGKDMEGQGINFSWGFYSQAGIWQRDQGAHLHSVDEVLVFLGTDPRDINYLGAEIEVDLGKESERYIFNKPTAVIGKAGLPHNPIIVRWVDRPYACLSINLSGE